MLRMCALSIVLFIAGQAPRGTRAVPSGAEFPPQDQQIWWMENQGLRAKVAARRLAEAPGSPETVRLLAEANNLDGVLRALRTIVDADARSIAEAFEALGDRITDFRGDNAKMLERVETLKLIVADARKRLPGIPREEAARAERVFTTLDGEFSRNYDEWPKRLTRFIEQYRGTEAALLAEVDVITSGRISQAMFDALDEFIEAHPRTTAAAKALYTKGFHWHTINTLGVLEPRDADPINRFMRVMTIVAELESGKYAPSEWVDKASSLIIGFFMPSNAKVAPKSIDKFIDAYRGFVKAHAALDPTHPDQSGAGYVITSRMADLFERKGERTRGVERILDELEASASEPAAFRYLRAAFFMKRVERQSAADHQGMLQRAREVLASLSAAGSGLYHRKALATLASLEFAERDYSKARELFRRYADSYPQSSWAWVAWVRLGQCEQELGNPREAATAFLEALKAEPELPPARVLGQEYAARAYETAADFAKALTMHERALADWDNDFGLRYSTYVRRSPSDNDPFIIGRDVAEVTKESLPMRIAQLQRSLSVPGGPSFERGKWLAESERYEEARTELQRFLSRNPKSSLAADARQLMHRTQLQEALTLADVENPAADEAAAMKGLEDLAAEPVDFAVTAARIAVASLLWKKGEAQAAQAAMTDALKTRHASQRFTNPSPGVEQDVAQIRTAVFLPHGGGVYATQRWNAFSWGEATLPFLVVNADVAVKDASGDVTRITLPHTLPVSEKVLYFDTEQLAVLKDVIVKLGGTKRREPRQIMETPNQPIGDSMQLIRFWNRFFHARPGHWGGWELETYPVVTEIQFTNHERTRAAARVTIGYSGATVELDKEDGKWIAKRLANWWIT